MKEGKKMDEEDIFKKYFVKMQFKRLLKAPFMNILRIVRVGAFQFSSSHRRLKNLKGKYDGRRCFIVGNGPSLTIEDLDKLKGETCFAFNKIYEVFDKTSWRPEFYMVLDNDVMKSTADKIERVSTKYKFLNVMGRVFGIKEDENTIFFCSFGMYRVKEYTYKKYKISEDVSQFVSLNFTVTCVAIEMAIYLGFKEIILLGVDNSFSRWIDGNGRIHYKNVENYKLTSPHQFQSLCYLDAVNSCFECYRDYALHHNIKILNATRGGLLNLFDRVCLDDIFEKPLK